MPRLHLGTGGRRPGRAVGPSVAAMSSSSIPSEVDVSLAGNTLDRAWASKQQPDQLPGELDFADDSPDNSFASSGDNLGGAKGGGGGGAAQHKTRASLDEFDSDAGEAPPTLPMKKKKSSHGGGSSNGGGAGGRPIPRRKPTAAPPTITIADLAKNKKGNQKGGKRPVALGNKGKPVGKPIPKPSNKGGKGAKKSGSKKGGGDENVDNRSQKSGRAGGKRKAPPAKQPKKGPAKRGSRPKGKKKGEMRLELVDSDEESSGYDSSGGSSSSSSEEEVPMKRGSRGGRRTTRGTASKATAKAKGRVLEDTDDEGSDGEVEVAGAKRGRTPARGGGKSDGTKSKGRSRSTGGKNGKDAKSNHSRSSKAKTQPMPKHSKQLSQQQNQTPQPSQILPRRALAIDNRVVPAVSADALARAAFLGHLPALLEGGLARGALTSFSPGNEGDVAGAVEGETTGSGSTVLAALALGTKRTRGSGAARGKGRAGDLATTAVVARASHLFEGIDGEEAAGDLGSREGRAAWLADFCAPVNSHLGCGEGEIVVDEGRLAGTGFDYGTGGADGATLGGAFDAASDAAGYHGPADFSAEESWDCFGDLLAAIEDKLADAEVDDDARSARHATLFTTDANLFVDCRSSAHVRGLEQFWKRLQSSTNVAAVTVVVVETTTVLQAMKAIRGSSDSAMFGEDDETMGSTALGASSSLLPDRLRVIRCVNDIRRRLRALGRAALDSSDGGTVPVDLRLEFAEGHGPSFQGVVQRWTQEGFAATCASSGVRGRLRFDLPETLDGTSCSISLDLRPTVLPHSLRSTGTAALAEDLRRLAALPPSAVEVLQTIPLASVDSALIYGVPLAARAGAESDASRHDEMRMLARQLWRYLGRNDSALVLRVRTGATDDSDGGLTAGGEQLFLLVCEECVQKPSGQALDADSNLDLSEALKVVPDARRRGEAPSQGMLYRYATQSQVLRFGNEDLAPPEAEEDDDAVSEQYLDYIERSLDSIVSTGLNPLLMGENSWMAEVTVGQHSTTGDE
ncbi:hypothetical protein ACHAXT_010913 [Thalassiosira profunda]